MRKVILFFCLLILLPVELCADTKIIERSAKKVPEWLTGAPDGCLIVTVRAASLSDAQSKAQDEIAERIMKAVASNLSYTQENVSSEITTGNGVESKDEYSRKSVLRTANIPFLKGVSLSKAADIYWVKVQDKKTKEEYYEYSVKYPFTRLEQETLSAQVEEMDAEKESELKFLEDNVAEVSDFDDIKSNISRLDALGEYFVDAPRLARVKNCRQRYNELYKSIAVTGSVVGEGVISCAIALNGHKLRYFVMPKVTTNCASDLQVNNNDGEFIITYSTQDCLPDEDNNITVTFRINGKNLSRTFNIGVSNGSVDSGDVQISATGRIYLTAQNVNSDSREIEDLNIRLTLDNKTGVTFGLKSIEINVPELSSPLVFDNIDTIYSSKGNIQITATAEGKLRILEKRKSAAKFVNGRIYIVNPATQAVESIRISLPYTTNWE